MNTYMHESRQQWANLGAGSSCERSYQCNNCEEATASSNRIMCLSLSLSFIVAGDVLQIPPFFASPSPINPYNKGCSAPMRRPSICWVCSLDIAIDLHLAYGHFCRESNCSTIIDTSLRPKSWWQLAGRLGYVYLCDEFMTKGYHAFCKHLRFTYVYGYPGTRYVIPNENTTEFNFTRTRRGDFVFWDVSTENRWFWITSRSFGNQANVNSWQPCLAGDRRESIHVAYRSHWPFYPSSDVCFLCPRHPIFCSLYLELCYWCSHSSRRGAYRYQWSLHTYKHPRFRNSKRICTYLRHSGLKVIKYCMLLLIVATWGCWDLEGYEGESEWHITFILSSLDWDEITLTAANMPKPRNHVVYVCVHTCMYRMLSGAQ